MHGALSIQVEAAWEAAARPFHIIQGLKIMADSIWEYSVLEQIPGGRIPS